MQLDRGQAPGLHSRADHMAEAHWSPEMPSNNVVAAIILAGGFGSRFGQPKYSVTLRGRRIVDMAVDLVRPLCRDVIVVLPPSTNGMENQ